MLSIYKGTWRRVAGYQRAPIFGFAHIDGELGVLPSDGVLFRVDHRTGRGAASNVAADLQLLDGPFFGAVGKADLGGLALSGGFPGASP